jgi:hypothetical protein
MPCRMHPGAAANDAENRHAITDLVDNMAWVMKKLQ